MRIVQLVPARDRSDFYEVLVDIERAAAARLGIELEVVHVGADRARFVEAGARLARATPRPDYVLLPNYQGAAHELLPALDAAALPHFLVVEGLTPTDRMPHGEPRARHRRWIGELVSDDVAAGHLLGALLADEARSRGLAAPGGKIHVGILSGTQTYAGQSRFQGWLALRRDRPELVQASVQCASWEQDVARGAAEVMLRGHRAISVVWAANDAMALGALEAARACGRTPGQDLLIGGVDLLPEALRHVEDGSLAVTLGGHILDGARALILLHDHFHGQDFAPLSRRSLLEPVTGRHARAYRRFLEARAWNDVDFARYSRVSAGGPVPELTLHGLV